MKKLTKLTAFVSILFIVTNYLLSTVNSFAQNVSINTTSAPPNSRALLDLDQAGMGLLIPRMVKADRDTITSIPTSLLIYQTNDTAGYYYYDGTGWQRLFDANSTDNDWSIDADTLYSYPDSTMVIKDGNVGIGTTAPDADALLEMRSTTKGFLPPRMTTGQRDLIAATVPTGLLIYNTTTNKYNYYDGTAWTELASGSGQLVQVVNTQTGALATGTTIIPSDNTIPQNTEGDEYMSLAITPKNTANILEITVVAFFTHNANGMNTAALFQDATAGALAAGQVRYNVGVMHSIVFTHRMTAGTTSPTTFKVRIGNEDPGTMAFNGNQFQVRRLGGVMASSITITEILP